MGVYLIYGKNGKGRNNMIMGKKVMIRQLESGDEVKLHDWRNNGKGNMYCGLKHGFMLSLESFRREVSRQIENDKVFSDEKMFLILKKDKMEAIGTISYRNWDKRNRSAEFGIEIGDINERGKGYGYDALLIFLDFMFSYLNLNRIELQTLADNIKAKSLYSRLGFKQSGLMRQKSFDSRTCTYCDVVYMDLLKEEWNPRKLL